jgi:RNA polymerase sigma-70 factor, ECF subfamily
MADEADRIYERFIILRCQTGDPAAFAEIVERYDRRLRYYLRKMLKDPHAADDATQEVWLAAFRGMSRLRDASAFPAWIYRIARDCVFRELRVSARRVVPVDAETLSPAMEEPDFTPEDAAEVHAGLDEIAPEAREVLLLRFIEGMSYEEIADVTSCPPGTVRSRIHYGKKELRNVMERRRRHESRQPARRPLETGRDGPLGNA